MNSLEFLKSSIVGEAAITRDWTGHALGSPETWPIHLVTAFGMCLRSEAISAVYWGPEFRVFYNDATIPVLGSRHPHSLGQPAIEVWREYVVPSRTGDDSGAVDRTRIRRI